MIGERKKVRNLLFMGIFDSMTAARKSEPITASGTAVKEKRSVLSPAWRKASLFQTLIKFFSPTKRPCTGLLTRE